LLHEISTVLAFPSAPRKSRRVLDKARFPLATAYVEGLPAGSNSFPSCRVRALVFEAIAKDFPQLGQSELPDPLLGALLRGQLDPNTWIPEVTGQIANLMVREECFETEAEFHAWTYGLNSRMFDKPFLRSVMRLMSPTLLVMGAAKRWSMVHEGTRLNSTPVRDAGGRKLTTGELRFPAGLFHASFLEALTPAFSAALAVARGRDVKVRLAHSGAGTADYEVSWAA
jgi:hypothetical protein